MTLTIELTPEDEAKLCLVARTRGMNPTDLARKLVFENLPLVPQGETKEADGEVPTIALFRKWDEEDANMTPEEIEEAQREWEQFKRNMNAERIRAGSRPLYP